MSDKPASATFDNDSGYRLSTRKVKPVLVFFFYAQLALLIVMYVRHNLSFTIDDSYVTYRYAYHFAEGYGLVFNVGERY